MRRTLLLAASVLLIAASVASADDLFIGEWKIDNEAGTPWATGEHVVNITSTTEADVRAYTEGLPFSSGKGNLEQHCLGEKGGGEKAGVFYSATYTWYGGGTIKGCLQPSDNGKALYGAGRIHLLETICCRATATLLHLNWDDDSLPHSLALTGRREAQRCKSSRAHAAATNEVRVVAVQPDVQAHKAGTPEEDWIEVCKDTVLQQGDEVSCDPEGAVTLQFADNSTVTVKNTTQLKIASFFTEGGVVKTEILLKMGEVAAKVHKSEATKSDFKIRTPTLVSGVRGTTFSVSYDPGAKATTTSVTEGTVEVDPVKGGLKTLSLTAGKEVEVTATAMSKVAKVGKAGARGGVSRRTALERVARIVARADKCGVRTPFRPSYGVTAAPGGWSVKLTVTGKLKGTSTWNVKGSKVTAVNALAKKLRRGCK